MSGTEYEWAESGRGAAPHQQHVIVTPAARAEAAFEDYGAHLSSCRQCNDRLLNGSDFCDEGKRLGDVYVMAYDASRGQGAATGTANNETPEGAL